jgi:hypothetical protein
MTAAPGGARTYTLIPQGGLGNRMRALDSALALAADTGRKLVVVWHLDAGLNCRFEELFEVPAGVARIVTTRRHGRLGKLRNTLARRLNRLRYDQCLYEPALFGYLEEHADLKTLDRYDTVCIASCSRFYGSTPLFRDIHPTADNQARIDHLTQQFGPRTIGIHIRRGDHRHAIANSPTELFVTAMQQALAENDNTGFFLATDCPDTERELRERFPGRIVTHAKRSLDRADATAIQDALVDLYGLAACERVVGSSLSSFTEVAAQIRGIPLQVIESGAG